MSKKRRTYTREYKVEAVKLVTEQGISLSEAGRRLGISCSMIFRWKQELEAEGDNAFPGYGNLLPVDEELSRLRAENKRLMMECDILKKAMTFLARDRA